HCHAFLSCPDWVAAQGMRRLAAPCKGDPQVISGESGAVGMGVLSAVLEDDAYAPLRQALQLDAQSKVLLFSTEGDTDPDHYHNIVWNGAYAPVHVKEGLLHEL
ncbi:MAG: diaminopropionate ammonia-lyase, partial [Clostridia bacterium]